MNSTALITGASAGLGAEFARQLAARGKGLVLVARRREPMEKLAAELREAQGVAVEVIVSDMTDPDTPAWLLAETQARGLQIDYLVNNAGSEGPDLIRTRNWPQNDAYLRLMMTSVAAMCHEFIPDMVERSFGRVVNVASVAGRMTVAGDYSYGPTKAYLIALSKGLASAFNMKEATPAFAWYDADLVVREGLAALEKGKDEYTSGRLYRFLVPVLRQRWSRGLLKALGVRL
jgi:short-subunit dehydrogenase